MLNVEIIEAKRIEKGITKSNMSFLMGYKSRPTYLLKVTGERGWVLSDVSALCKILDLEPNDIVLLDGVEVNKK